MSETKNSFRYAYKQFRQWGRKKSQTGNRLIEIWPTEKHREERLKKKSIYKQSLSNLRENYKQLNKYTIGCPEGEKRQNRSRKKLGEIKAELFSSFMKGINLQI